MGWGAVAVYIRSFLMSQWVEVSGQLHSAVLPLVLLEGKYFKLRKM